MEYFENLSDDELQKIGFDLQLVEFKKPFKPISRGRLLEKIRKLVEHSNDTLFLKTKIQHIKEKRRNIRKEENRECHNDSTSAGNETDALMDDQLYFYNPPDTKLIFCFDIDDINYVLSIKKNFHTNVAINEIDLNKMKEWKDNFIFEDVLNIDEAYDKIFKNVKVVETPEMKFQEKLRKMSEILSKHNPYTNALEMGNLKLVNYELFIESKPFNMDLKKHVKIHDLFQVKNYIVEQILLMLQSKPDSEFLINKMIDDVVLMNNRKLTLEQLKEYRKEEGEEVYLQYDILAKKISKAMKDGDVIMVRTIFEKPVLVSDYEKAVKKLLNRFKDSVERDTAWSVQDARILKLLLESHNFDASFGSNLIFGEIITMAQNVWRPYSKKYGTVVIKEDTNATKKVKFLLAMLDVNKPFYKIDLSRKDNIYSMFLVKFDLIDEFLKLIKRDKKYAMGFYSGTIINNLCEFYPDNATEALEKILSFDLPSQVIIGNNNEYEPLLIAIKNYDEDKVKVLYKYITNVIFKRKDIIDKHLDRFPSSIMLEIHKIDYQPISEIFH
jgi:hypothetical protein